MNGRQTGRIDGYDFNSLWISWKYIALPFREMNDYCIRVHALQMGKVIQSIL